MRIKLFLIVLGALSVLVPLSQRDWTRLQAQSGEATRVAVLQDGPSPLLDALTSDIETQLKELLSDQKEVTFEKAALSEPFNLKAIGNTLDQLMVNPNVDLVLGVGTLVNEVAADPARDFDKPVVTTFMQRAQQN